MEVIMNALRFLLPLYFAISLIVGCGSSKSFVNFDTSDLKVIEATGRATLDNEQVAVERATIAAQNSIAGQIETFIESFYEDFYKATNDSRSMQNFERIIKAVSQQSLQFALKDSEQIEEAGKNQYGQQLYRAEVKIRYHQGEVLNLMKEELQKERDLWTEFQQSQTNAKMEEQLKKYEEFKKKIR